LFSPVINHFQIILLRKRKILHQPIIKMSAKMANNQTNEKKKSIWGESKRERKIMFIGVWGVQLLLLI